MNTLPLSDSTRRAIRTAVDNISGFLIVLGVGAAFVASQPGDFEIFGLTPARATAFAATIGAVTVLFNKVKNALEDAGFIPALLKTPAPKELASEHEDPTLGDFDVEPDAFEDEGAAVQDECLLTPDGSGVNPQVLPDPAPPVAKKAVAKKAPAKKAVAKKAPAKKAVPRRPAE